MFWKIGSLSHLFPSLSLFSTVIDCDMLEVPEYILVTKLVSARLKAKDRSVVVPWGPAAAAGASGSGLDGSASGPSKPRATVGLTALRRRSGATEAAHQSHRSDKIQKTFTF